MTHELPADARTLLGALFPDDVMTGARRINLRGLRHGGDQEDVVSQFVPSVAALLSDGAAAALHAWNAERSVYVAPGIRQGHVGAKRGVLGLLGLWADLDAKAYVRGDGPLTPAQRAEGKRLALQRLREILPPALQPSLIVDTGGGLQCWWFFKEPAWLGGDDYTVATLEGYLRGIATALGGDPAVTQLAALMRLPGYVNRKYPDAPVATIVETHPERRFNPSDFDDYRLDVPEDAPRTDGAEPSGTPGPLAPVLATCDFLQWCRDRPAAVREPLWYAMLSNLVRLEGGREAAHAFSRGYPGYSPAETDRKLDHALAASGPITCAKIQALGFASCPVDGHGVRSPAGLAWRPVAPPPPPAPARPRFRRAADIASDPPPVSIVDDLVWPGGITTVVSEPSAGKTFLLLDLGAAVSDGWPDWHGRRVRQGSVAYLAYETSAVSLRLRGLIERGDALAHLHLVRVPLPLSPRVDRAGTESPSAGETLAAALLAELAAQIAAEVAPPLRLLAIDTVRASLVGSEDSSESVSAYLRAVARLLAPHPEAGAILAHHAGWQDVETPKKRERGSSAFRGNVDGTTYLEASDYDAARGQAALTLRTQKVRDGELPPPLRLLRRRVVLSLVDDDGRPRTTCLIAPDPRTRADLDAAADAARLAAEQALDARAVACIAKGKVTSAGMLRGLLHVRADAANACLARLLQSGRVLPPARQRQPYTLGTGP